MRDWAIARGVEPGRRAGWALAGILGLAAVVAYGVALWRAPGWMHATTAQAAYNARVLVISVGGAIVVLTGLLYTAFNYRLSRRGQVTDRFTIALERLGSSELYVRIGGVHALEHVMRDSAEHHDDVIEVLTAFIRDRAPRRGRRVWHPVAGSVPDPSLPAVPALDIQAALTALAHRPDRPERQTINLTGKHLAGALLAAANLTRANLHRANFTAANLNRANLIGADLATAHFGGADLTRANLAIAHLHYANLTAANLTAADLTGADLAIADLTGANLTGANLNRAILTGAILTGADLSGANLHRADLTRAIWRPDAPVPAGWQRGDTGRLARADPSPGGEATKQHSAGS
jgi:pentapeptide repeat protein